MPNKPSPKAAPSLSSSLCVTSAFIKLAFKVTHVAVTVGVILVVVYTKLGIVTVDVGSVTVTVTCAVPDCTVTGGGILLFVS